MQTKHIVIPACLFILFAGLFIFIGEFMPPDRVVYCPNPDCHGHDVTAIDTPDGAKTLYDENWSYYKCDDCGQISVGKFTVDNLLIEPVWDIKHYLSIADKGYVTYPCNPAKHWPAGDICGNVGWFPAWPLVVKALSFNNARTGLILLPFLLTFFGTIVFYNIVVKLHNETVAFISTLALLAAPASFYLLTGFPYALMLLLFSGYLYFLYNDRARGRIFFIPALAFMISLSYPTGVLTAVIPLIFLINNYRSKLFGPRLDKITNDVLFYLVPFVLGPLAVSAYFYFTFDDFYLFAHFQEKYDRNWGIPFVVMWKSLVQHPAWEPGLFMPPRLSYEKLSLVYYGLIFIIFPPYKIKPELLAYGVLFYLFSPATGNIVSVYRHYIILFPLAIMIGASPRPMWLKILFIVAGLIMTLWWFYPFFLNGYLI